MQGIPFVKDQVLRVKVLNIRENVKTVNKQNGTFFRHDITVEDGKGGTAICEYLSKNQSIGEDFVVDVYQHIKVIYVNEKGSTIEPAEPPAQQNGQTRYIDPDYKIPANSVGTGSAKVNNTNGECKSLNVAGNSFTFCLAYVKDLVAVEIAHRDAKEVTMQDIDKIVRLAEKMNDYVCDFFKPD